ncbi:MAG: cytochrome ubiquinol oxidase subunit I [Candidatus Hydrogenedentes bacterium]|nr:cytochrome ubiquinol oxidase subunit I [Candidatus Hydrogenedentota bacterium]
MSAGRKIRQHLTASLIKVAVLLGVSTLFLVVLLPRLGYDYGFLPILDSRTVVWVIMELHLMFAAFVLGVPFFAMIVEIVGVATKDERYDRLALEFTRLLALAFTATAVLGVLGVVALVLLYPAAMRYLTGIFSPTFLPYALCIIVNAVLLVVYYYAWDAMQGRLKWLHIGIAVLLNLVGTVLMCIANAWTTFMMSPGGVTEDGTLVSLAEAIQNPLWWPINIHRLIANVAFGGGIAAAYAAIRFLASNSDEERAHYDWMGYVGNFVALWALIPLPFAGYYLGKEIYAYSAQMGTSLMGGAFSWLFIIQAVLIGVLFISANYYMWLGLGRIPGGHRYYRYILGMEILIFLSMAVWMTPHTLVASMAEARRMGGAHHPLLGVFGVMSAKNTAVNLVILTTFLSFVFYRRANLERSGERPRGGMGGPMFVMALSLFPILFCGVNGFLSPAAHAERRLPQLEREVTSLRASVLETEAMVSTVLDDLRSLGQKEAEVEELSETPGIHHAGGFRSIALIFAGLFGAALLDMFVLRGRIGGLLQWVILATAAGIVLYFGVKGYFVSAEVRIGYSVYQVMAVLFALIVVTALDLFLFFGAKSLGKVQWGKMPQRSQYVLVLLAVTFTLTIGLMGIVRSGIRETWHVYGVMRDVSPTSYTPTMGYGATVVGAATLFFFLLLFVIFWFGMRGQHETR